MVFDHQVREAWKIGRLVKIQKRFIYLLLLPTLLIITLLTAWPLYQTARLSFMQKRLEQPGQGQYIGLKNYTDLLGSFRQQPDGTMRLRYDRNFYKAVGNTIFFTGVAVFFETLVGMMIALIINSKLKARGLIGSVALLPAVIPTVVSARMWAWIYHDVFGVMNDIILKLGFIDQPVAWLSHENTGLIAISLMEVWRTTPFVVLLLLAGLQIIPGDIYEAAGIDGANKIQQFYSITLPLLKPALLIALIFRTLDSLRLFDVIKVVTDGSSSTEVMATYAYRNIFEFHKLGYGSAISIVTLFISAIFVAAYAMTLRIEDE